MFSKRLKQAQASERRIKDILKSFGLLVYLTGQEYWLNPILHEHIKYIHNDFSINLLRYFPDLFCYKDKTGFFVECKSTSPKYYDSENFSIETASLEMNYLLTTISVKVFIIFENRPYEFYCESANTLPQKVIYSTNNTQTFEGSKTPLSLISKESLSKLTNNFWGNHEV